MKSLLVLSSIVLVISLLHGFEVWLLVRNALILGVTSFGLFKLYLTQYEKRAQEKSAKLEEWAEKNKIVIDREKTQPKPFKVEYNQAEWDTLMKKLELTRYFEPMDEKIVPKYEYGFDPEYSKVLVEYWKTKFDWKAQIEKINRFPQFRITVDDVTIHYVKYKTNADKGFDAIPIILMDGWPGHYFGFYKVIDELENKYKDMSFDIIVPSYPGLGFSTPLNKPITALETAMILDGIMRYYHGDNCQYILHGEDWGSTISTQISKLYPQRVRAFHTTIPFFNLIFQHPKSLVQFFLAYFAPGLVLTREEMRRNIMYKLSSYFKWVIVAGGYLHLQGTKPDSFGHGLTDSPVGLMAYVLEKYSWGSFGLKFVGTRDAMLEKFDLDDLLTIVMYYWTSNSINSSNRFYKSNYHNTAWPRGYINSVRVSDKVIVGVQYFPEEILTFPAKILKNCYPGLKRYKIEPTGGHFASFESPEAIAKDFAEFVKSVL